MSFQNRTCDPKMSKAMQNAKARKANAFKPKKKGTGVSKTRKSILYQMDTGPRAERKNIDTTSTLAPPLTASFTSPTLLNGAAQGVGTNERVGRKAIMKSIALRYIHTPNAPASQVRILVVYDKQPNGALPASTDVVGIGQFHGHISISNSDRFVVLMDEISESSQSSAINISGKRYLKCNLETMYGGTTSGIASINSGSIFIMAANNADPTVGAVSALYYSARIRYTDV